jgi:PPK2 family polyphosphate:nucleotide phosphotransferase
MDHVNLGLVDPGDTFGMKRKAAERDLFMLAPELSELQRRLYAAQKESLLIVLQGMDTSGKDGTIRHAMGSFNPQGVRVASFKVPTAEEARHPFLWRIQKQLPAPGEVVIFNRSHYEDVVVTRVKHLAEPAVLARRYEQINRFEADLKTRGTTVVKLFLHISSEEQRERLLRRLHDPKRNWKFSENDIRERAFWDDYRAAYGVALARCARPFPWYVVPADHKWSRNWLVSNLLVETLREMRPEYPRVRVPLKRYEAMLKGS